MELSLIHIFDDIILVVGKDQLKYVQEEIVRKYHFTKVKTVVDVYKRQDNNVNTKGEKEKWKQKQ